jgi:hypothetical protein
MQVGEIYYWNTDKAAGHDSRFKYHVYIGECEDGHAFLFISKADYGGDFAIHKKDYSFFPLAVSYIMLSGHCALYRSRTKDGAPELKGRLTKPHMQQLF